MFIKPSEHKRANLIFNFLSIVVSAALIHMYLSSKPIAIIRLRDQPAQFVLDFVEYPLFDTKKVQILIDPFTPFTVHKLSFIQYQLVIPKESMNRSNNVYAIQFVDENFKRIFLTYKMNNVANKLIPELSQQQIITTSNTFKTNVQEQYPYFDIFPYFTDNLKVQYDKPHVLTVYIRNVDSATQSQAMLELSAYLEINGTSIQTLTNKGVQIEYKELPGDYSRPQVSE